MLHEFYFTTLWQCQHCPATMVATTTPANEPAISCQNPACGWTIDASCSSILTPALSNDAYRAALALADRLAEQDRTTFYYVLAVDGRLVVCADEILVTTYLELDPANVLYGTPGVIRTRPEGAPAGMMVREQRTGTYTLNGILYESETSASERAAIGGRALVAKLGSEHMRTIGQKGGKKTTRTRGRNWMRIIARRGWAAMRVQLATSGRINVPVCLACGQRLDQNGECVDGFACGLA